MYSWAKLSTCILLKLTVCLKKDMWQILRAFLVLEVVAGALQWLVVCQMMDLYTEYPSVPEDQQYYLVMPVFEIKCCYNWCDTTQKCLGFVYKHEKKRCMLMQFIYSVDLTPGRNASQNQRIFIKSAHSIDTMLARGRLKTKRLLCYYVTNTMLGMFALS